MRIALASLTTDLMKLVAENLPEGSSEQTAARWAMCLAQALGEMRGDAVARYEAAQAGATLQQDPAHIALAEVTAAGSTAVAPKGELRLWV